MNPLVLNCHPADEAAGLGSFAAAELQRAGFGVRIDARPMDVADRFWPPVHSAISNRLRAEAWAVLLTDTIMLDSAAVETVAYAAAGAKGIRGQSFPVIALRPGSAAIPVVAALRGGMKAVAMSEHAWAQAVRRAGAAGVANGSDDVFSVALHHSVPAGGRGATAIEFRPLGLTWSRFFVAALWPQEGQENLALFRGVRGLMPEVPGDPGSPYAETVKRDGEWAVLFGDEPASRRESYFLFCKRVPPAVRFGVPDGHLQYTLRLRPV